MGVWDVKIRSVQPDGFDLGDVFDLFSEVTAEVNSTEVLTVAKRFATTPGARPVGRPRVEREIATSWLMLRLADDHVRARDLILEAALDGVRPKTLRRAAEDMGVIKTPEGGGGYCEWSLPGGKKKRGK
jgi:hypothetical protein